MKTTKVLKEELKSGIHDAVLRDIYMDENLIPDQKERYVDAVVQYEQLFGEREVAVYSAPGRSEIGGNHTDHQHGMVLAASVNLDAVAIVGNNENDMIEVVSKGYPPMKISLLELDKKKEEVGTTPAIIRGVVRRLKDLGYQIGGFSAYITSDVIGAAGLSSSACFETMIGTIISGLFNEMQISMVEIAKVGQYAENVYFDKPCGLMDQMACAVGGLIHIDFENPEAPVVNKVDVDFEEHAYHLCIVDTKGSHADLTQDYADVPAEMNAVAGYFDKSFLRAVNEADFYREIPAIRAKMGDRCILRALHFFEEEKRVIGQVTALKEGRFTEFLSLIKASGDSSFKYLQNVYTNNDVQNQSVSIALATSDIILKEHGVSRVHGGGFAGTIQAFVENTYVDEYKQEIEKIYGEGSCYVLNIRKYGGIKVI